MSTEFDTEEAAYEHARAEIFPKISSYFRLFKTPQGRQDEYIQITAFSAAQEATFQPSIFRLDRDLIDMLISIGIPPHLRFVGRTPQGQPTWQKLTLLPAWRREPSVQRGRLSGLCFSPGGELIIDARLNRYMDVSVPAITPPTAHALDDIMQHILTNICNGQRDYAEYFLNWLAHMVQFPASRPKTAVAIIGGQGTGKGILVDLIERMMGGDRNCNTTASSTDTKSFNFALAGKLFVVFDEATFAGDRQQSDFMKKLVTEPRIRVEQKGVDAYEVDNFARVLITSNNMTSAVPTGLGGRRFLTIETRNDLDAGQLKLLANKIGNNGPVDGSVMEYASWFKHFLATRDLSGFEPTVLPMQNTGFETKLNVHYKEEPIKAFFWEWLTAADLTLYRHTKVRTDTGEEELDSPMRWAQEVLFGNLYAVLEELCKASYASVPARNRVKGLLEEFGATTVQRAQGTTYASLPPPLKLLEKLRRTARFDNPISDEQFEVIANWKDEDPDAVDDVTSPPPAPIDTRDFTVSAIDDFFSEFDKK